MACAVPKPYAWLDLLLYAPDEVRALLAGALALRDWTSRHPCPIRSATLHTLILLLATSGLRISEALHLTLQDVGLAGGVLSVRQSKFRKSRLVPVSAGTLETLRTYHDLRIAVTPADPAGAFFVSGRGTGYSTSTVQAIFHDLTVQAGLSCGNLTAAVPGSTTCERLSPSPGCCSGIATASPSWPGCRC